MNRQTAKELESKVVGVLQEAFPNLVWTAKGGAFDDHSHTLRIEAFEPSGLVKTRDEQRWNEGAELHGLPADALGREVTLAGAVFVIVGLTSTWRVALRRNGRLYRAAAGAVSMALRAQARKGELAS